MALAGVERESGERERKRARAREHKGKKKKKKGNHLTKNFPQPSPSLLSPIISSPVTQVHRRPPHRGPQGAAVPRRIDDPGRGRLGLPGQLRHPARELPRSVWPDQGVRKELLVPWRAVRPGSGAYALRCGKHDLWSDGVDKRRCLRNDRPLVSPPSPSSSLLSLSRLKGQEPRRGSCSERIWKKEGQRRREREREQTFSSSEFRHD